MLFVGLGEGGRKKLWTIVDEKENDFVETTSKVGGKKVRLFACRSVSHTKL